MIEQHSQSEHIEQHPVAVNGYLLYVTNNGDFDVLWSFHSSSNSKLKLLEIEEGRFEFLGVSNKHLIFSQSNPGFARIWKTDGLPLNTVALPFEMDTVTKQFGGDWFIDTDWDAHQVFRTNGESVTQFEVNGPHDGGCVFDNGNFVINSGTISSSVANDYELLLVSGTSTQNLTVHLPPDYGVYGTAELSLQNSLCFIKYQDENFETQVAMVNASGDFTHLNAWAGFENLTGLYFDENSGYYYGFQSQNASAGNDAAILKIDLGNKAIVKALEYPVFSTPNKSIAFFNDKVIVQYKLQTTLHYADWLSFFDKDLQPVASPAQSSDLNISGFSSTANWLGEEYLIYSVTGSSPLSKDVELWHNSHSGWVKELSIENETFKYLITASNEPQAYLENINNNSLNHKIYRLYKTPLINKNTAGAWFSPDHLRQGININHGNRGDGSEYLFITVYTFDNDSPLWMAGVAELADDLSSVTIPVYQYQGLNWWQAGVEPTEGPSGTLTISHSSCDQLSVSMTLGGDSQTIEMERMVNTETQAFCQD